MQRLNVVDRAWRSIPIKLAAPRWSVNRPRLPGLGIRLCSCTAPKPSDFISPSRNEASPAPLSPAADHRAIGTAQELFVTSSYSPGSPLFQPNGTHILNKLISFLRTQYKQYGFQEVLTPNIYKQSLWEISGHWQNYKDDMYEVRGRGATGETIDGEIGEDESYGLKPMNCPGHCILFKSQKWSYRDLPVRFADFSPLHRNEVSGSLTGLTRVRRFHQDDGHIFCRPQQIGKEIQLALNFTDTVMKTFNLGEYRLVLSTRPEKDFIGSLELWDLAEKQLRDALGNSGRRWEINEGDGAFYGPKIDFQLQDSDGKFHQLSTIQLDLNLPERFGLEYFVPEGESDYDASTGGRSTPVLIHRAIFGSLERFLALLIEHYNGRWPFWLSPRQGIILTVNQDESVLRAADRAAEKMCGYQQLPLQDAAEADLPAAPLSPLQATFQIDVDKSARSLSKKIREAQLMKYNLIFVIGPKNLADGSVDIDLTGQVFGKDESAIKQLLDDTPGWDANISSNGKSAKLKMKADDVHNWLLHLERRFY
ncbi:threonyl-tRNA synthetase [Ophidiomyces ophidiicola]|uniref:threonyl-tRNA synthetase n=1 Tax=Ophidiomyces ophidiicola TaxID=1387563 RepID=UPI0020C3B126|nr:threonyl-tRNA synthetase [Ophidiomyces ophidiicola]KAI1940271.1 threonyl-tRNA synthetase [Ophidiomyces ophidiicola]KAI2012159.1 threonyl-tRNA synthetase [Ophidiomyces ophidiicola]KAI2056525.1 threonyl-tRNA synthetase [Ophidiomyces ophidiicola]KAI2136414.1 threonyl-tRNA synthetase [Ophidiomyces ophidiicola]KAI2139701.1 threonyl-tRNA synthetase [Ophidiomyces ophidiicola]